MGRQDLLEHMHTKHQLCGICTLDWWTGDIWLVERYAAWKLVVSSFFFFFAKTPMFFMVFFPFSLTSQSSQR
jgi:hypothetical protein